MNSYVNIFMYIGQIKVILLCVYSSKMFHVHLGLLDYLCNIHSILKTFLFEDVCLFFEGWVSVDNIGYRKSDLFIVIGIGAKNPLLARPLWELILNCSSLSLFPSR